MGFIKSNSSFYNKPAMFNPITAALLGLAAFLLARQGARIGSLIV